MTWNDLIDRLRESQLEPVEETYMEHYGKVLSTQRPEFKGRYFRCTYGVVQCGKAHLELFLFPWEGHAEEFMEVVGQEAGWFRRNNVVLHIQTRDSEAMQKVLAAI